MAPKSADIEHDRRTVFVQGVSFEMDDKQFEEAFSEIGPIRKCFLLRHRGQQRHKGSGFVQFALPEDAATAVKAYDGKILLGRPVQVIAATKRAPLADRKQKRRDEAEMEEHEKGLEPPLKKAKTNKVSVMGDNQKALRTIALGGYPASQTEQAIQAAMSAGQIEAVTRTVDGTVEAAAKLRHDGCTGKIVLVTYQSVKAAVEAVTKLHGTNLAGRKQPGQEKLWARQLKGEGSMVKKWRLILRNLPFNVQKQDLQGLLYPAALAWEITIPRKEDGSSKGFAFVSFTSKAHAERALKFANGKRVKGRLTAIDWAVAKTEFETGSMLDPAATADNSTEAALTDSKMQFMEEEEAEQDKVKGKVADPKTEKDMMRILANQLASDGAPNEEVAQRADPETTSKKHKQTGRGSEREQKADNEADTEREQRADTAGPGPSSQAALNGSSHRPPSGIIGRTVFVRGLGSDVSKQQLQARMESFGAVKACRLVITPTTKQPKGTAFVEFEDPAKAKSAAEASANGRSGKGPGVSVAGLTLDIDIAVTQDDARAMASAKAGNAGPKDKRNLYLAKEGLIEEGSAIWQDLSKGDQDKRSRASKEKATKLRSPNFYVSTTRVNLRNLPFTMEEKALKTLLIAAVKERATRAVPIIKQVKVLRDTTKKDKSGKPQCKGIAFAEFKDHEHALCALRQLNNNPAPFGKDRRPIVEFAVENAQTMKKREQRQANFKGRGKTEEHSKSSGNAETGPVETPQSKKEQRKAQKELKKAGRKDALSHEAGGQEGPKAVHRMEVSKQNGKQAGLAKGDQKPAKPSPKQPASPKKGAVISNAQARDPTLARKAEGRKAPRERKEEARKKPEKGDHLDSLISKYRDTLFGESKSSQKDSQTSSLKRWFE